MRRRIIISETERKNILSLYEETQNDYVKENDFLKRYVGKTFNVYEDKDEQNIYSTFKIKSINYDGFGITIKRDVQFENDITFECLLNPSKISNEGKYTDNTGYFNTNKLLYNKSLINNINSVGSSVGITWCKKPKADFGMLNKDDSITS